MTYKKDILPIDDNGELHGKVTSFFTNGNIQASGTFIHGRRHGKYINFFSNGKVCFNGNYNYGKRVGLSTWFDYHGIITSMTYFIR